MCLECEVKAAGKIVEARNSLCRYFVSFNRLFSHVFLNNHHGVDLWGGDEVTQCLFRTTPRARLGYIRRVSSLTAAKRRERSKVGRESKFVDLALIGEFGLRTKLSIAPKKRPIN